MPSFRDLFPDRWLKPHVINGFRPRVVIEAITIEEVFNPRNKKAERKFAVKFHGKELRMLLNKTNATALADICKTEDYTRWVGHEIVLWVGRAPNGKDTIIVGPVPDAKSVPPPDPPSVEMSQGDEYGGDTEPPSSQVMDPSTGEILDYDGNGAPAQSDDGNAPFDPDPYDRGENAASHPADAPPSAEPSGEIDGDGLFETLEESPAAIPWYTVARDGLQNGVRVFADDMLQRQRDGDHPASAKAYGYLCDLVDTAVEAATGAMDGHKRVFPILCQKDIGADDLPSSRMVGGLLTQLATQVKDADGNKIENPNYSKLTEAAVVAVYRAAESVGTMPMFADA